MVKDAGQSMNLRWAAIAIALTAIAVAGHLQFNFWEETAEEGTPMVTVRLPDALSAKARSGLESFEANCAACHGRNAAGQFGIAPPLVHAIYEPGHHGDESFQRAVALGAPAHHWGFGDMPPVEGLTRGDVDEIVAYIRELQRANGIE